MNWYRHPYSESIFLLSVPYFNVFHWFFNESVVQNVSLKLECHCSVSTSPLKCSK